VEKPERQRVHLTICGVEYRLLSEKPQEYMQALGQELNDKIKRLQEGNVRLSATQAAVLCALEALDEACLARETSENLRTRIQEYLEDAAQMKKEAELSRHEAELLHREIADLRRKKG
jgi:cell division protein ZapA